MESYLRGKRKKISSFHVRPTLVMCSTGPALLWVWPVLVMSDLVWQEINALHCCSLLFLLWCFQGVKNWMALQINHNSIIIGQQEAPAQARRGSSGNPEEGTATSRTSNGPWTPSWFGPRMNAAKSSRPFQTCTIPTSAKSLVRQKPSNPSHRYSHICVSPPSRLV